MLKEHEGTIISIDKISTELNIPLATLRRDLNILEEYSKIIKVHGGAQINSESLINEEFLDKKVRTNVESKKQIARLAVKHISKGNTVFLDAGSSVFYISKILDPELNLTIVTNSILTAQELWTRGHKNIYMIGGKITNITGAIVGYEAIENIKQYSFDVSFIGVNAIDENKNIYTTSSEHGQIKIIVMNNSNKTFGLADQSKFNSKSFFKFSTSDNIEIITNKKEG